jgi:phenylacetic acid degradation protein
MIYEFKGIRPVIDPTAFIHPQAAITGDVTIGKNVYIGPGAAIRGDWGRIIIEDGCNVQENCTIHMFPGVTVWLKEGAHMGHGAIVHGSVIGRNTMIGMNSVVMDNVEVGDECIIGALSFVREGVKIPPRSLVAGNPAKVLKEVSADMLRWKTEGTALYQALPKEMHSAWRLCEPLRPEGSTGTAGKEEAVHPADQLQDDQRQTDQPQSDQQRRPGPAYKPWKETSTRDSGDGPAKNGGPHNGIGPADAK